MAVAAGQAQEAIVLEVRVEFAVAVELAAQKTGPDFAQRKAEVEHQAGLAQEETAQLVGRPAAVADQEVQQVLTALAVVQLGRRRAVAVAAGQEERPAGPT